MEGRHSKKLRTVSTAPEKRLSARLLLVIAALVCAASGLTYWVYGPALRGPFVFDDLFLPYAAPQRAALPLVSWIAGVRPVLYFSYWLNQAILGPDPLGYHAVNLVIHVMNAVLVFLIAHWLLKLSDVRPRPAALLAIFAGLLFLSHPVQTESAAYIASRSETLSALFVLAALALFVSRLPGVVTWPTSLLILFLFAAGCATKEQAVALFPALLVTDYFWNQTSSATGALRNWRVYLPMAVAACAAVGLTWKVLAASLSAGFHLSGLTWYQYFFTECRAFFTYVRLFALPVHQTADYDFPISKTILDHGSLFGLAGIVALAGLAIYFRRRYRLASFGILLSMILLAPTSSFVPLRDPIAEHRMYLAVFALSLVLLELLWRIRISDARLAAVCMLVIAICGALSYTRNRVWSDPVLLWRDAIAKSPGKLRPYTSLTLFYMSENRCGDAARLLENAPTRLRSQYYFLVMWGEAEGCLSRFNQAADLLAEGAKLHPDAHVYVRLGTMRKNAGERQQAYDAFTRAIQLDPSSEEAYLNRGYWYESGGLYDLAAADYRHALQLNPANHSAKVLLEVAERRMRSGAGDE
jgi:tetratricopeptide (TPR) repeat protein